MNSLSSYYPDKRFKAAHLNGQYLQVTIESVGEAKFNDGTTTPELFFHGQDKSLTVNKTNTNTLIRAFGDNPNNLTGKSIELRPAMTTNLKGEPCETIIIWIPQLPTQPAQQPGEIKQQQRNAGYTDQPPYQDSQNDFPEGF